MYKFKECRQKAGLSQKSAALSLHVKPPSISDWENGKTNPTIDNLIKMAQLYQVSIDHLLGVTEMIGLTPDELLGRVTSYEAGTLAGLQLDERRIITEYRKLNDTGKMKTFEFILMARNTYPADQPGEWQGDPLPCVENQKR